MNVAAEQDNLSAADLQMFSSLGIGAELVTAAQLRRLTDAKARHNGFSLAAHAAADLSGIVIPYLSPLNGHAATSRLRRDHPERDATGKTVNKYLCPRGDNRHLYFVPGCRALLADVSVPAVIVEGEKSALALAALAERHGRRILVIATGGCWGWIGKTGIEVGSNGDREETRGPLPDWDLVTWPGRRTLIGFDANTASNPKVRQARQAFTNYLLELKADVRWLDLPQLEGVNGPDDYLAIAGDQAMLALLELGGIRPQTGSAWAGGQQPAEPEPWPKPPEEEAYYGLAGDVVRLIEPHTEASSVALLVQILICFGNIVQRSAHFVAEASRHYTNLFAVLVGVTSMGRKGSSWAQVLRLFRQVDSDWADQRIQSGLSSGEGLIWAVRDPISKQEAIREKCRVIGYQEIEIDPGITEKRMLIFESEFASPLTVMTRDGNTLSVLMRQAWDSGDLRTMTKNSPARATGALISIVGHITRAELLRQLNSTEMANGFANRFLWVCTTRSKELPEGGNLQDGDLTGVVTKLAEAVKFANTVGEMKRAPAIKAAWSTLYHELTANRTGLLGAVTSRAEAQVMRLACLYALLDLKSEVEAVHLYAAAALWEYCLASAHFIFGSALGDPTADAILEALRTAPSGLDRTNISGLFGRNKPASDISRALRVLQERGLAHPESVPLDGGGRPREVWFAVGGSNG